MNIGDDAGDPEGAARSRYGRTHEVLQHADERLLLAGPDRRAAPTEDQHRRPIRRFQVPAGSRPGACRAPLRRGTRRRITYRAGVVLRAAGRSTALLQHDKLVYSAEPLYDYPGGHGARSQHRAQLRGWLTAGRGGTAASTRVSPVYYAIRNNLIVRRIRDDFHPRSASRSRGDWISTSTRTSGVRPT